MNRRTLLHAAAAAPLAGFIHGQVFAPAEAQTQPVSPLRSLYHEWQAAKLAYNTSGLDEHHPDEKRMFAAIVDREDAAAAFIPATLEDMAFKIIFADDNGLMNESPAQFALIRLAYGMVGITPVDAFGEDLA